MFRKERLDTARDRRLIIALLVPLALIPLITLKFDPAFSEPGGADDLRIEVAVAGEEPAEEFLDWLVRQPGVEIADGPSGPGRQCAPATGTLC